MTICIISPEASKDLDEIFDYFAGNNVDAGERFVIAFEKNAVIYCNFQIWARVIKK